MKQAKWSHCPRCGGRLARDNGTGRCAACQAAERERLISPPALPATFWEHEPVWRALADRHLGQVIRAYRCHPYHGRQPLRQETVARWLGITQAQLSRIENGAPIVHLDRLTHWAQLLQIPAQLLWFRLPNQFDDADRRGEADVTRRNLLAAGGAAVAGALASRPISGLAHNHLTATMAVLGHALLSPNAVTDKEPATIEDLTVRTIQAWQLRQQSRYECLSSILPALIHQAQATATALDGAAHEQATRVLVHAHNAASSLFKRVGDTPLALLAADRAVQTARTLDDPALVAACIYRMANVLLTANRLDETKTIALDAADLVEPGHGKSPRSLATWGGLLLTAAVAAARNGDRSETWELMGEARVAARLLDTDHADIYAIFGPTNVAIHGVQIAVKLGDGRDAVRRSQRVEPKTLPASLIERRGQFLIDLARGHALAGDDHEAVATLIRAESIAPQELGHSGEARSLTNDLLQRGQAGRLTELRELAARVGVTQ